MKKQVKSSVKNQTTKKTPKKPKTNKKNIKEPRKTYIWD